MKNLETESDNAQCWNTCPECQGRGRRNRRLSKKARLRFQRELDEFNQNPPENTAAPLRPKGHPYVCSHCDGTGLISSTQHTAVDDTNYPNLAIIGGGIGGVALAVACLHRGIPFTLYERDANFDTRSQGYGLTLQQASKAIEALGIRSLKDGITSTRHVVHDTEGTILGEWGIRKWGASATKKAPKRTNIHIARQALRLALLDQLEGCDCIKWNHQLTGIQHLNENSEKLSLSFNVDGETHQSKADLLVGADGIRSTVRKLTLGEETLPLSYLGCIVILGICPLAQLSHIDSDLLDSATVFQTANGNERIYMMPYSSDAVMWQLSFPMSEDDAKNLSASGAQALKEEACRRTQWHSPIPEIMAATLAAQVSGYPVYDRDLLQPEHLQNLEQITLIGDAAHPMSPFKGQGANQALLDALSLAREIYKECRPFTDWRAEGIRKAALNNYEVEMLKRSAAKVKDSADAAEFLHSETVLHQANEPRGRCLKS